MNTHREPNVSSNCIWQVNSIELPVDSTFTRNWNLVHGLFEVCKSDRLNIANVHDVSKIPKQSTLEKKLPSEVLVFFFPSV